MNASSLCKHLRTKSMFIPALAAQDQAEGVQQTGRSSHCWCNCTLTETGPDDRPVGEERCSASRACFEE
ncbi:MAG TPA: hypothetical protein VG146_17345 [Verrucomicrobiae bacterium]|nr:hypothetical protein [Verrucomicrobiae bacterium]